MPDGKPHRKRGEQVSMEKDLKDKIKNKWGLGRMVADIKIEPATTLLD